MRFQQLTSIGVWGANDMGLDAQLAAYKVQIAEGTLTAEEGKLRALKALFDAGVLTEDEFSSQKKAVLTGWLVEPSGVDQAPVMRPEYE